MKTNRLYLPTLLAIVCTLTPAHCDIFVKGRGIDIIEVCSDPSAWLASGGVAFPEKLPDML